MILLSDCLAAQPDEGTLKVATSLAARIKQAHPTSLVISYGRKPPASDRHLVINKLFLSRQLRQMIRQAAQPVLYIPFASNTSASIVRTFILSIYSKKSISVLFALRYQMNSCSKILLRLSRARIITLTQKSFHFYDSISPGRTFLFKTGIDTKKFHPVSAARKKILRTSYGIPPDQTVVLHVGHMKTGRNLQALAQISQDYFLLLVISTATKADPDLRARLEKRPNSKIITGYVENIAEIYQLADIYLFPVLASANCIDLPLSILEAAACNLALVTSSYGQLQEFLHCSGYYPLESASAREIATQLKAAAGSRQICTRDSVLAYDWANSIQQLTEIVQ